MSAASTITKIAVATYRINQNSFASKSATGPCVSRVEGEFPPQAARRMEDKSRAERIVPQRLLILGILTSHFPKNSYFNEILPKIRQVCGRELVKYVILSAAKNLCRARADSS